MINKKAKTSRNIARGGFTLVEMLVSVTLILLMMTMFASVFQIATNSLSTHRAISESDQRIRMVSAILKNDFAKSTMRFPLAYYPTEDVDLGPQAGGLRDGYLYISTNNPESTLDDFVQFTVNSTITKDSTDTTEFFGRADPLSANLYRDPNQPEVDDGSLSPDGASSSPAAQISLFVRNGNLYRRVILVRRPRRIAGADLTAQPTSGVGVNLFDDRSGGFAAPFAARFNGSNNDFHQRFDFSAIAGFAMDGTQSAQFVGIEALGNKVTSAGAANQSLGIPNFRFGFNQFTGLSREHDSVANRNFIGRLVHAETSSPNFNWPQNPAAVLGSGDSTVLNGGNPYNLTLHPLTLPVGGDWVTQYDNGGVGGARRMEDLLLANVHEFGIEIWDERAGRYVVPGYGSLASGSAASGDYHISRNLQRVDKQSTTSAFSYGPLAPYLPGAAEDVDRQPHVFDTWNPLVSSVGIDTNGDGSLGGSEPIETEPPYIAYDFYPPRRTDSPPGPAAASSFPTPVRDPLNPGSFLARANYWTANNEYFVGDIVFAVPPEFVAAGILGWDVNGDGLFQWSDAPGRDQDSNLMLTVGTESIRNPGFPDQGFQIAYRCVRAGISAALPPNWLDTPGRRISESVNSVTNDAVVWESFDNRRPLKALRLKLRFINPSSKEPRQLTLNINLTDES